MSRSSRGNYEIKRENRAKLKIRLIGLYTAPLDPSQSDQFLQKGDTESKNTLKGPHDQRPKASSSEVIKQSFVIGRIISEALVRSLTFLIKQMFFQFVNKSKNICSNFLQFSPTRNGTA